MILRKSSTITKQLDGAWGSFKLTVRKPTFQEVLQDQAFNFAAISSPERAIEAHYERLKEQIRNCVVGWSDVQEEMADGRAVEIPFSWEKLQELCGAFPTLVDAILDILFDLYRGRDVADLGNSIAMPVEPSEAPAGMPDGTAS